MHEPSDEENPKLLAERLRGLEFHIGQTSQRESRFVTAISIFSSIVVAVIVGLQVYNSSILERRAERVEARALEVVASAESEIERITGATEIAGAEIRNLINDGTRYINATTWFYKGEGRESEPYQVYTLATRIPFQIVVNGGAPGRLLGFQIRFTDELSDALDGDNTDPGARELIRGRMKNPSYSSIAAKAITIAPGIGFDTSFPLSRNRLECHEIQKMHDKLVGMRSVGKVYIKPVFENYDNSIAKEEEFILRFHSTSIHDCETLEKLPAVEVSEN